MFEQQRDALRPESLDLQELQRGRPETSAAARRACRTDRARSSFLQHGGEAFADAGHIGDLAFGIVQDVGDAFRITFDGGRAVAVAADAEAVFAGDLHQIGGFIQQACEFAVLQSMMIRSGQCIPVLCSSLSAPCFRCH